MRKYLLLALALVMMVALLAACNGDNGSADPTPGQTPNVEPTPTPTAPEGPYPALNLVDSVPQSVIDEMGAIFTSVREMPTFWTDLPGGSEAEIQSSLKRLFAMDGSIKVYPGHGDTTTIGAEAGSRK